MVFRTRGNQEEPAEPEFDDIQNNDNIQAEEPKFEIDPEENRIDDPPGPNQNDNLHRSVEMGVTVQPQASPKERQDP